MDQKVIGFVFHIILTCHMFDIIPQQVIKCIILVIKNLRELCQPQERFAPKFKRNQEKIFF